MKTRIAMSHNYGGNSLCFVKEFDFPFTPFYGLIITDGGEEWENNIEIKNSDYQSAMIYYDTKEQGFHIDIRYNWPLDLDPKNIDDTIELFTNTGWKQQGQFDIEGVKYLIEQKIKNKK